MRSVLQYDSKTCPLGTANRQRFSVFGHRCSPGIDGMWWGDFVSNSEIRRPRIQPSGEGLILKRLRWLGCFAHARGTITPRLWAENRERWSVSYMQNSRKTLTSSLSRWSKITGLKSIRSIKQWLERSLHGQCRGQWSSCIWNLHISAYLLSLVRNRCFTNPRYRNQNEGAGIRSCKHRPKCVLLLAS